MSTACPCQPSVHVNRVSMSTKCPCQPSVLVNQVSLSTKCQCQHSHVHVNCVSVNQVSLSMCPYQLSICVDRVSTSTMWPHEPCVNVNCVSVSTKCLCQPCAHVCRVSMSTTCPCDRSECLSRWSWRSRVSWMRPVAPSSHRSRCWRRSSAAVTRTSARRRTA